MSKEIEAKFINIDKDKVINRLENIGAKKVFNERLLRRCIYNLPVHKPRTFVRLRDEVDKITLTYKSVTKQSLDGVEEIELVIDNFEKGKEFLKSIGLEEKAYQESKRIRYKIGEVEFDIDTWPALMPWIEIEASTEELVRQYTDILGFDFNDAMFGSADLVYERMYNLEKDWINTKCPLLKFDELPPELQESNLR